MPAPTILFDLNGTLTDASPIGAVWDQPDLGLAALSSAVESSMVDALTDVYRPFSEHVAAAITAHVRRRGLDESRIGEATKRASRLPAHPDARAALDHLSSAGHRLAVLTNSGAEDGTATLEAAGLADAFSDILGVDAVRRTKPHPRPYAHALESLRMPAGEVLLVAAHGWDVTGAKRAGLRTCWIARGERTLIATAEEPDIRAGDLLEAARRITSRA